MQTEETFRDIKNHRWGWSFEDARSESDERLNALLLIAALAALATLLVGIIAEHRRMQRYYQANTIRNRASCPCSSWAKSLSTRVITPTSQHPPLKNR